MADQKSHTRPSTPARRSGSPQAGAAQAAALPWRDSEYGVQVLLVTSLTTGRWVLPKGWAEEGEYLADAAAREAFEEAGLTGTVSNTPLGGYRYEKRRRNGSLQEVAVEIYAFETAGIAEKWPEKNRRRLLWVSPEAAATMVAEPDLARLLQSFGRPGAARG